MVAVDEKKAEVLNYIADGYSQKESFQKAGISETDSHQRQSGVAAPVQS